MSLVLMVVSLVLMVVSLVLVSCMFVVVVGCVRFPDCRRIYMPMPAVPNSIFSFQRF